MSNAAKRFFKYNDQKCADNKVYNRKWKNARGTRDQKAVIRKSVMKRCSCKKWVDDEGKSLLQIIKRRENL